MKNLLASTSLAVFLLISASHLAPQAEASEAKRLFVRADSASIVESPKLGAKAVASLKRGDELTVISQQGQWTQVKNAKGAQGFIHRAFVSDQPVLAGGPGAAGNDPRSARRRVGSATMGVRGLSAGLDKKSFDGSEGVDEKALQQVEAMEVPEKELQDYERQLAAERREQPRR